MLLRAILYKMLNMTWNVCKINLRRFWAFKNFAHALTRGRTRTRAFFDLKLTGLILTLIMINMNEKYLLVMKIWSWDDFQKISQNGALDDVISQGQGFEKLTRVLSICPIHMCAKYQSIWLNHFKVISLTKKWVKIRKINK